jgi:hypothetical protein
LSFPYSGWLEGKARSCLLFKQSRFLDEEFAGKEIAFSFKLKLNCNSIEPV